MLGHNAKTYFRWLTVIVVIASFVLVTAKQAVTNAQDVPELIYYFPGQAQTDLQQVNDAVNVLLKQKIGATIQLKQLDFSAYDQKMNLINASGENYDIAYCPPWTNSYYQNINKGYVQPLDDLLKTTPKLYAAYAPGDWEAARVNGHIYGTIQGNIWVKPFGPFLRKDLADKYGLDITKVHKLEDLEPWLAAVKKGEGIAPISGLDGLWRAENWGFDPLVEPTGNGTLVAVKYDDPTLKAFDPVDTPEFQHVIELASKWFKAGYFPKIVTTQSDADSAFKAGKTAIQVQDVAKPGNDVEKTNKFGTPMLAFAFDQPVFKTTGSVIASLQCISATSKHADLAIKYIELMNTDPQVYNLLAKGIEGKHWVWDDKAKNLIKFPAGVTSTTSGYNPSEDWMWGNQFLAYYISPDQVGNWDKTIKLNTTAKQSVALGFSFVSDPVKTELAQISAVDKEYYSALTEGELDPVTGLAEFKQKLKDAGIDKVIAEVQKQLDAWKASKTATAASTAAATAATK